MSESMAELLARLAAFTERAESAESELLAVREDNHSMMLEIDGLRTERDRLAAELAKLRAAPALPDDMIMMPREADERLVAGFVGCETREDAMLGWQVAVRMQEVRMGRRQPVDSGELVEAGGCAPAVIAAPAVPALSVPDGDDFNGTTPHLIQCMEALVRLDADGVLVPHGIGRSASRLLSAAANRLRKQTAPSVPEEWRKALQEAHDTFQRYADLHRAKDTRDGHEKANANQKLANKLYALLQSAEGYPSRAQNEVRHD